MTRLADTCRQREIAPIMATTPLLVPSFSSKGFAEIAELHKSLSEVVIDASLVSAYDIYYYGMDMDSIYNSDILVVDSGGYEARLAHDLSDQYLSSPMPKVWTRELHKAVLDRLQPYSQVILVNFDFDAPKSIPEQCDEAASLFSEYDWCAHDFLCKPTEDSKGLIDVGEVVENAGRFNAFSIVGFTEKELGTSLTSRCKNLIKIRYALNEVGVDSPIHVFGCLDPLTVVAYYACGADMFDGLSWLRYAFFNGVATYHSNANLMGSHWDMSDYDYRMLSAAENERRLRVLQRQMAGFALSHDWSVFDWNEDLIRRLSNLLEHVGLV